MFERFTKQARQAVAYAVAESRRLGAQKTDCEHLLMGLAHGRSGPAAEALAAVGLDLSRLRELASGDAATPLDADALALIGIDLDQVRRAAEAAFGPGALDRPSRRAGSGGTRARMSGDGKKALELGLRVAQSRHDGTFTAGHLLIGILDQGDNAALRLLAEAGVDAAALRASTIERLDAAEAA